MNSEIFHKKALDVVARYHRSEYELIEILESAEKLKIPSALGYSSLFVYATAGLGLSEEVAYIFINVARKAREVPALKEAIRSGQVSVSKAKRISSVLKRDNQKHWLGLATSSSKRELERLVAAENPRDAVVEKAKFVSRDRVELQVGVSEKFMLELRRAQDLLSQKKRRPVSLEETLAVAVGQFVQREDPVKKAQRQMVKGKLSELPTAAAVGLSSSPGHAAVDNSPALQLGPGTVGEHPAIRREPIPASTRHKLNIKFQGQCGFVNPDGSKCGQRRFLDIHHVRPVSEGGSNELENLELLCTGHHRARHLQ